MHNNTSTGTTYRDQWSIPERIKINELPESIEMIYKETSMYIYGLHLNYAMSEQREERIFKIVFSCKGGKWHKSKPIYGKIIRSTEESYNFE